MQSALLSSTDTMLIMVPFLAIMLMVMFKLDERVAAPKAAQASEEGKGPRRSFCEVGHDGQARLYDPDGQLSADAR